MNDVATRIGDIIRAKGAGLRQADLAEIQRLLDSLSDQERSTIAPWTWEGVALIVNDPDYAGDVPPML